MGLINKVKNRARGHKTIKQGISDIKNVIEAFDEDVTKIPEVQDHCVHCSECRSRAENTSAAFRKYFALMLKGKK